MTEAPRFTVETARSAPRLTGIYAIRCIPTQKVYVGQVARAGGFRARWWEHLRHLRRGAHHSPKLQRAWLKYGEAAFEFLILEHVGDGAGALVGREQAWMDELSAARRGFNIAPVAGSNAGIKRSAEFKAAVSSSTKGERKSTEHAAAIAKGGKEKWADPEFRAKQVAAKEGAAYKAKMGASCAAEEFRATQAAKTRALWQDPAYRQRMQEAHKARMQRPGEVARMHAMRPTVQTAESNAKRSSSMKAHRASLKTEVG